MWYVPVGELVGIQWQEVLFGWGDGLSASVKD
jgi:hypothetical protein